MVTKTGAGKYFIRIDKPELVIRLWLYNFDIDGAELKEKHIEVLKASVVLAVRDGGSVKLMGLASTTASDKHNRDLALSRLNAVETMLRKLAGNGFSITKSLPVGEIMARAFHDDNRPGGTLDDTESEIWRAVVVNAWNKRGDPVSKIELGMPLDNKNWASDVGNALDITSMAVGAVDFVVDMAALTAAAAVTSAISLGLSCVSAIVGMPLLFYSVDAKAKFNGKVQGAADALQDCVDQFKDSGLDLRPLSQWPTIKVPELHGIRDPMASQAQIAWREGQRQGRQEFVTALLEMERNPKPIKLTDGKTLRLTARMWLRIVARTHKDNAGVELVINPVNARLLANGSKKWPTW